MTCRYCGARNAQDEHRCTRCGRRLHAANARPAPDTYPIATATAPAEYGEASRRSATAAAAAASPRPVPVPDRPRSAYQPVLFPQERRELRVIPFESIAPAHVPASGTKKKDGQRRAARQQSSIDQPRLDLRDVPGPAQLSTAGPRYSKAPVASLLHRMYAAALDVSLTAMGIGLFALVFQISGGDFVFTKATIPAYLAIPVLIALFYRLLYCLGNGDTAGVQWLGLTIVDFDGRKPTRAQRLQRMAFGWISAGGAALGLLWALTDDEQLTWHDSCTKTFPTPRKSYR